MPAWYRSAEIEVRIFNLESRGELVDKTSWHEAEAFLTHLDVDRGRTHRARISREAAACGNHVPALKRSAGYVETLKTAR